mgnify:CR=1 FL=1
MCLILLANLYTFLKTIPIRTALDPITEIKTSIWLTCQGWPKPTSQPHLVSQSMIYDEHTPAG